MAFLTNIKNKTPLGIYVHVPFCRSKCQYCDFYSVTERTDSLLDDYIETEAEKNAVERIRAFVDKHLRKLAHFAEYALLGAEVFLLIYFELHREGKMRYAPPLTPKPLAATLIFSALIAFADETIQLISDRGPAISDMWIDIFGYTAATLVFYVIFIFVGKKTDAAV